MLIVLQLVLYCVLFLVPIKCALKNNGINCLYFYPKEYVEEAQRRGIIADKDAVMQKGKRFMVPFCIAIFAVLIIIIAVWNGVKDFKTAYIQSYLFLVVMNWFDGIVLDRLWVGHSKVWIIKGMEGVTYIKSWKNVLVKRSLAMVLYLVVALVSAGIVVLIGKIF